MGERPRYRILFCVPTTALSGGVTVIFEIAGGLAARGHDVSLFSFAGPPLWRELPVPLLPEKNIEDIDMTRYDFIVVSNAFMLPMLLPRVRPARAVFFTQDYESFHHSGGSSRYEDFICDKEAFTSIYRLPVPIITESRTIRQLLRERTGCESFYVPVGIDKRVFHRREPHVRGTRARVMMVGNYLMPYKGMVDGFEALQIVARTQSVELVLATQESRNREMFDRYEYPIEIRFRPGQGEMADIYASCDLYCCTSWYEGLGLPALEAFCCGVPVVSTRDFGVSDYGVDEQNLLLAQPNDAEDLAMKISRALGDEALRSRLREGGFQTVRDRYDWSESAVQFEDALSVIDREDVPPAVDDAAMRDLLDQLETEGHLTPITVFRRFDELAAEINAAVSELVDTQEGPSFDRLAAARNSLAPYLENPHAQYHRAFRTKYDLCQLVLSLRGDPRFSDLVRRIMGKRSTNASNPAAPSIARADRQ